MAKPSVTLRTTKGTPLTYDELDENFENLRDATLTVTDGTTSTALDLNSTLEFTAGANITLTENNGVITIASTVTSGDVTLDTAQTITGQKTFDGGLVMDSDLEMAAGSELVGNLKFNNGQIQFGDSGNQFTTFVTSYGALDIVTVNNQLELAAYNGNNIYINASGVVKLNSTSGTPSDTANVDSWLKVEVGGFTKYLPLYD